MFKLRRLLLMMVIAALCSGVALAQHSTLSGNVTDADSGSPITEAFILAFGGSSPTGDSLFYFARTDGSGLYHIDSMFAGSYSISVEAAGYQQQAVNGFVVSPNAPSVLDFQLIRTATGIASVSGTVSDAATGFAVSNASLTLSGNGLRYQALSDNQGDYTFSNVLAGNYSLQAFASGYEIFVQNGIQVDSTAITGLDIQLNPDSTGFGFASLSGTISDSAGVLFPATVELIGYDFLTGDSLIYSTINDSSGFYEFDSIRSGFYTITATVPGYDPQIVYDFPILNSNSQLDFFFRGGGTGGGAHLHGVVVDSIWGHEIENAMVELISYDPVTGDSLFYRTITDLTGSFFFDNIPNATYTMITSASGYQTSLRRVEVSNALPGFIVVGLLPTTPVDGGVVKGSVSFDGSALPVQRAMLDFLSNSGIAYRTYSDSSGNYSAAIPPGDYIISCSYYYYYPTYFGFYNEYYDDVQDISLATSVSVAALDTVSGIDFGIPDSLGSSLITVRGQVTDESGIALENAIVTLQSFDNVIGIFGDSTIYRAITDASGQYEMIIDRVFNGFNLYVASAEKAGYDIEFWFEQPSIHLADPIFLYDDSLLQDINFTLAPDNGGSLNSISGTVSDDSSGGPLAGAFVVSSNTVTGELRFAFTDPGGEYTLDGLGGQPHLLLYAANGYIPEFFDNALIWEDATPVTPSGATNGINASLAHFRSDSTSGRITGVVADIGGQPIAGVLLTLVNDRNEVIGYDFTNALGAYDIAGLHGGNYTVQASKVAYNSEIRNVTYTNPAAGGMMMLNIDMSNVITSVDPLPGNQVPRRLQLEANYPNPFNPGTSISFGLPETQDVRLVIYNVLGQKVRTVFEGRLEAGSYQMLWNGLNDTGLQASSGIYFYALETGSSRLVRRMLLSK